jgi:hypothetical protein
VNYYNYFTEIEEHFVRRRGKHLLVSPMDWSLIATWRQSGVPLHVALRGIDRAMDGFLARPRRSGKVSSLFYCHDSVMEEYARFVEAHTGEESPAPGASAEAGAASGGRKQQITDFLRARIAEITALAGKQSVRQDPELAAGIERVLGRLREIAYDLAGEHPVETAAPAPKEGGDRRRREAPAEVDEEALDLDLNLLDDTLSRELRRAAGPDLVAAWEEEAKKELKIYRKRLPKETYQKVTDNFMRRRLHRHFEIEELSLFHL